MPEQLNQSLTFWFSWSWGRGGEAHITRAWYFETRRLKQDALLLTCGIVAWQVVRNFTEAPEGLAKRLHSSHQLLISCPCRFTFCRSTKQTRWADMLASKSRKPKTIIKEGHDTARTLLAQHSTHHTPVLLLSPRGIVGGETQASSAAARGSHLPGTMYRLLLSPINPSINQSSG